jgi:O-antigen/teichoic acid export membrane protein
LSEINQKAKAGIKALIARQVVIQGFTFLGGIVLARTLGPLMFGIFAVATTLVNVIALFGDVGLSAALVQRRSEITDKDIQVGFTLQQCLISAVVVTLLVFSPEVVKLMPKAPAETVWLVRALAFSLYLTSWRSTSVLQLERHLDFGKVAKIEVAEQLIYQGCCVALALLGFKVWSLVIATLIRGIVGTVLAYITAPWPIKFAYDKQVARGILAFGIPMQLNSLFAQIAGYVTPFVGGRIIGPLNLGYVFFASANGKRPLNLSEILMRTSFPHFSRLQDNKEEIERLLNRYLTLLTIPTTLNFVLIVCAGRLLIHLIYSSVYDPAATSLSLCAAFAIFEAFNQVASVAQEGIGLAKVAMQRSIFRSVVAAVSIIFLSIKIGFNGVAWGSLIVSVLALPFSFTGLPKGIFLRIIKSTIWLAVPVVFGLVSGFTALFFLKGLILQAIGTCVAALLGYMLPMPFIAPSWFRDILKSKLKGILPASNDIDTAKLEVEILEADMGADISQGGGMVAQPNEHTSDYDLDISLEGTGVK